MTSKWLMTDSVYVNQISFVSESRKKPACAGLAVSNEFVRFVAAPLLC